MWVIILTVAFCAWFGWRYGPYIDNLHDLEV